MNKKLTFTGGEPNINWDDVLRDPIANRAAIFAIMEAILPANPAIDEGFIISGCDVTVVPNTSATTTAGYIWLNQEILKVDAHTELDGLTSNAYRFIKDTTYDANGTKTFNDSVSRETWQKNRAILDNVSSVGTSMDAVSAKTMLEYIAINGLEYIAEQLQADPWTDFSGSLGSGWSATTAKYRVDAQGYLEIFFEALDPSGASTSSVYTLPTVSVRPDWYVSIPVSSGAYTDELNITTGGLIGIVNYSGFTGPIYAHIRVPRLHP